MEWALWLGVWAAAAERCGGNGASDVFRRYRNVTLRQTSVRGYDFTRAVNVNDYIYI